MKVDIYLNKQTRVYVKTGANVQSIVKNLSVCSDTNPSMLKYTNVELSDYEHGDLLSSTENSINEKQVGMTTTVVRFTESAGNPPK